MTAFLQANLEDDRLQRAAVSAFIGQELFSDIGALNLFEANGLVALCMAVVSREGQCGQHRSGTEWVQNLRGRFSFIHHSEPNPMLTSSPSIFVSAGMAVLIAWRMYTRIRRMVGRQKLSRVRPWVTALVVPVLMAVLLVASLGHPVNALALFGGAVLGVGLGVYGLRLTRFEETPAGLFYTPNAHLGIALSMLLVGRIAYRLIQVYVSGAQLSTPQADFIGSPFTLCILGTMAGYYVTYAVGLLRWRYRVTAAGTPSTPSA